MPTVDFVADLERVVIRFPGGLLLEDVERSGGVANKRTRHAKISNARRRRAGQIRSSDRGLVRLAYVVEAEQAVPLRSHIPYLQRSLASELLLDIDVVVFHVRRFDVRVNGENVALLAATVGRAIHGLSSSDCADVQGCSCNCGSSAKIAIGRTGSIVRGIRQMAEEYILGKSVIK